MKNSVAMTGQMATKIPEEWKILQIPKGWKLVKGGSV